MIFKRFSPLFSACLIAFGGIEARAAPVESVMDMGGAVALNVYLAGVDYGARDLRRASGDIRAFLSARMRSGGDAQRVSALIHSRDTSGAPLHILSLSWRADELAEVIARAETEVPLIGVAEIAFASEFGNRALADICAADASDISDLCAQYLHRAQ